MTENVIDFTDDIERIPSLDIVASSIPAKKHQEDIKLFVVVHTVSPGDSAIVSKIIHSSLIGEYTNAF